MDVIAERTNLGKPDFGWIGLSLGGAFLSAAGVIWLRYDPELPKDLPAFTRFPGMTIAQMGATLLIVAGAWATTLGRLAIPNPVRKPQPLLHRFIRLLLFLAFLVIFPISTGISGKGLWFAIPVILMWETTGLLWLHQWLVAKGFISFRPKPGSALYGTTAYGARLAPSGTTLRSQYEEKIRQAGAQEERNRLARDLHDSIKQQLFAIHTSAATAQVRLEGNEEGAREAIDQIRSAARDALTEMDVMLDQLRAEPLESIGLAEALKKLGETTGFRIDGEVECKIGDLSKLGTFEPKVAETVLRVAQESLANVARHARASQVTITLDSSDGGIALKVQDDGRGFNTATVSNGMGTANMRSRVEELGGRFNIVSNSGGGSTTVSLFIPVGPLPSEQAMQATKRMMLWGFVGPIASVMTGGLLRRLIDKELHPDLSRAINWAAITGTAGTLIIMVVLGHKEMQRRRRAVKQGLPW